MQSPSSSRCTTSMPSSSSIASRRPSRPSSRSPRSRQSCRRGANPFRERNDDDGLRRVELDELALEPQRRVHAALEAGWKLLDLLAVLVTGVTRALRIAIDDNVERRLAVQLHQPVRGKCTKLRLLVAKEVRLDDERHP